MELLSRVQAILRNRDITATIEDDELCFYAKCGVIGARMVVAINQPSLSVAAFLALFVPDYRRAAMCEALSRANWQLRFARLEMDHGDGELRVRADMPLKDAEPTDEQLRVLVYAVWSVAERYAPALVQVMASDAAPALAVTRAEASWEEENRPTEPVN